MLRTRALAAALLLATAAPALAADGATEICLLRSTETLTAKGKPHVFETELDCGKKPTAQQTTQGALVHNAMDTADALEIMANAGYEVEAASWRDSFTGRQILGVFTLVKAGEAAPVVVPKADDELPEQEEDEKDAEGADDASEPVDPE